MSAQDTSKYRRRRFKSVHQLCHSEACGRLVVVTLFTCAFLFISLAHLPILQLMQTTQSQPTPTNTTTYLRSQLVPRSGILNTWFGTTAISTRAAATTGASTAKIDRCAINDFGLAAPSLNSVHAYLFSGIHGSSIDATLDLDHCQTRSSTPLLQSCTTLTTLWKTLFSKQALLHVQSIVDAASSTPSTPVATTSRFKHKLAQWRTKKTQPPKTTLPWMFDYSFLQDDAKEAKHYPGRRNVQHLGLIAVYMDLFGFPSKLTHMNVLNAGTYSPASFIFTAMGAENVVTIEGKGTDPMLLCGGGGGGGLLVLT